MALQNSPHRVSQFGKPGGVIKLKVKKKRPSGNQSIRSNILKPINSAVQDSCGRTQALKRNNPFRCSPRKKPNLIQETKPSECRLFEVLDEDRGLNRESNLSTEVLQSVQIEYKNSEIENSQNEDFEALVTEDEVDGEEIFPLDWSLKYKVRFTSPRSFNWCGTLKTLEEGEGLSTFVRCGHVDKNRSLPSSLCSFTKVWLHPSLPWLDLFPRKSADGKAGTKREFHVTDQVASSLQSDWVFSFRSVFNLLRVGFCPYFYLVANQNTMLFHAAEITGDVHVVITPTTKGLRDALRNEGINFAMPHLTEERNENPDKESKDGNSKEEPELSDDSDDDTSDKQEWLESMGLDKEEFPLLNSTTVTPHQISNLRSIDQQPASTIVVKGADDTHALFNFLLNCKSLVASTGSLSGVPPTLLAPVAFDGATIRSLKVSHGTLKHQQAKGMAQLYSLDISGPLLPGGLYELCQLLKVSQEGNFTAMLSVHQPSVALNVPLTKKESGFKSIVRESYTESSISSLQLAHYQQPQRLEKVCLKELKCKGGLFTWTF